MSAICGLWRLDGRSDAAAACARMLASQEMYGPHHRAQWAGGGGEISLGRRLYRILPEDVFDRQPLVGGAGTLTLVADLRLDNREELSRDLQLSGERVRKASDADILLAAWERWDEACVDRLVGDYAFAVWDGRRRRLVLARDVLGQRPLHYHRGKGFFAFASMPKGLHALPDIPRVGDGERAAQLVALLPGAASGSRTFFEGIERVEAGALVVITPRDLRSRRYWEPKRKALGLKGPDEYAEALRSQLDEAVRAKLRGGGGRVGAQLSGGWDSSAVAATAARLLRPMGGSVTAFTAVPRAGYDGPAPAGWFGDEGRLAAATAALYQNMEHVLVRSAGRSPLEYLDRDFFSMEEPIHNPCNGVWTRAINDAARSRSLSVVLCGQWGNLTLTDNGIDWLPELIARGHWARWIREARALVRNSPMNWRGALGSSFSPWIPALLWRWLHHIKGRHKLDVAYYTAINPTCFSELELAARSKAAGQDIAQRQKQDTFEARMSVYRDADSGNYLKGTLAEYGIDLRDPTSDRRLVEFSLSVPMDQIVTGGRLRVLARRALADRLPRLVLDEPGRGYQALDWHEGLTARREELARELERLAATPGAARILNISRLRRLIADWPTGGWETPNVEAAYRMALLRGVSVGHFLLKTSGSNH